MASLHEHLAEARHRFERCGITPEEAAIDAEVLARHVLGWDRAALLAHAPGAPPGGFDERFAALVDRRCDREPVALIVGEREFWGLSFEVTRDVLVPRPETEFVVEAALELAAAGAVRRLVDVGTGSGCIAVALAVALPGAQIVATDVSPAALAVAARNAARHDVQARITFVHGPLLDAVEGRADLIVSNPPYVATSDIATLPPEVLNFEPHDALLAGADGLAVIRRLLETAAGHLAPSGHLVVEFGFGQAAAVSGIAAGAGWRLVAMHQDLQQIPRVAVLGR